MVSVNLLVLILIMNRILGHCNFWYHAVPSAWYTLAALVYLENSFFFFCKNLFYLFTYFCAGSSLLCVGYSLVTVCGLLSWWFLLRATSSGAQWASVVAALLGLSSCGAWVFWPCGMWDLPRPEMEPVSPALAGGFLTTEPPGMSW